MILSDAPGTGGFSFRNGLSSPGRSSLIASFLLHAFFAATLIWLARSARSELHLSPSARVVRLAGFPFATPHRERPLVSRAPSGPQRVIVRRLFAAPHSAGVTRPAPMHLLSAAPALAAPPEPQTPEPQMLVPLMLPQLGPAPVRIGDFSAVQPASTTPTATPPRPPALAAAGFGELRSAGATQPAHTVSAGSFEDAIASSPANLAHARTAGESGFGAASAARPGPASTATPTPARNTTPLEIQFKPAAEYTEEARRRRIEGEVLLEMLFLASGEVRLLRVVRGLGYGLDEAAVAAAGQVRFIPARRDGSAVDSRAVVHIQFQLAY